MTYAQHLEADRYGQPLTAGQLRTLGMYATAGSTKEAAARMHISTQTVKNQLTSAYRRLGVDSNIEAFSALGWLQPTTEGRHHHRYVCVDCGLSEPKE